MKTYSYSRISTYLRCPHLFMLRYVDQVPPEQTSLALPFGSAIHDIVSYSIGNPDSDQLDTTLQDFLLSRIDSVEGPVDFNGQSLEEIYDQAKRMLDAYLQEPLTGITSIEQSFCVPVDPTIELEGFIDFLRDDEVIELKTSGKSYSQLQVDLNLQATCYAAAMMRSRKIDPVAVRFVVITKTKTPKVQNLVTWRSKEDLDLLASVARNVDQGISSGSFPRNMCVQNCSRCEYRRQCMKIAVAV